MLPLAPLAARPLTYDASWTPQYKPFSQLCTPAVLFYLFHAKHGTAPTFNEFTGMGDHKDMVKAWLRSKKQLRAPAGIAPVSLTPGSLLLFVKDNDVKHACIAVERFKIGGYNQPNWFDESGLGSTHGVPTGHSIHNIVNLQWILDSREKDTVRGNTDTMTPCKLYTVGEHDALSVL